MQRRSSITVWPSTASVGTPGPKKAPKSGLPGTAEIVTGVAALDNYKIDSSLRKLRFLRFLLRRQHPVVMINLLVFREKAIGAYEGQSGWAAAQAFLAEMERIQKALGWRNVWTGRVKLQLLGESHPTFEVISLIEYPTPLSILKLKRSDADMSGRDAGLLGQVYIASTTRQEPRPIPPPLTSPAETNWQDRAEKLNISKDRFGEMMQLPADEPLELVELLRYADPKDPAKLPEGSLRWRGTLEQVLMGACDPPFHDMVITRCQGPPALLTALEQERAGVEGRWAYVASALHILE